MHTLRRISSSSLRQTIPIHHDIHLEQRIPLHAITLIVQPRQDLVQELRLLLVASQGLEFRQPDRSALGDIRRFSDVVFEVLDAFVGGKTVPVDGEKIDVAAIAGGEEGGQVRETLVLVGTVADGGGTQFDGAVVFLVEGFHVFLPALDGLADVHVGLGGEVGFIEGEEVLGAGGDGGVGVLGPAGRVVGGEDVPEHGDKFLGGVDGAAGGGVPVLSLIHI